MTTESHPTLPKVSVLRFRYDSALIDEEDLERVLAYGIWWRHTQYVRGESSQTRERVRLHRFILGAKKGDPLVMHLNGNGLDCRKENLAFGDQQKNSASHQYRAPASSKYRGVCFITRGKTPNRWQAGIRVQGKFHYLGRHRTQEEAAAAYDAAAIKYFGPFACPNLPVSPAQLEQLAHGNT